MNHDCSGCLPCKRGPACRDNHKFDTSPDYRIGKGTILKRMRAHCAIMFNGALC